MESIISNPACSGGYGKGYRRLPSPGLPLARLAAPAQASEGAGAPQHGYPRGTGWIPLPTDFVATGTA